MAVTWKKLAYETDVIVKTLLTTKGDIIYASAANTPARLGIGSATDVLSVSAGGIPEWAVVGAPGAHHLTHENGGADEISVAGLSGELSDNQPPKTHATTHKNGQSDELLLHELGEPTAAVDFDSQQATDFVLENSVGNPVVPILGKIYFKTGELSAYVCTSIA